MKSRKQKTRKVLRVFKWIVSGLVSAILGLLSLALFLPELAPGETILGRVLAALIFSIIGGLLVQGLKFEGEINEKLKDTFAQPQIDGQGTYRNAANCSFKLFRDLLLPLVIGAVISSFIHNYVPVKLIETINGYPLWLVIPLVALIGFPIYSNIMVLAPICFILANKGMNQGAVATFLMSGAGISFPTAIVLKGIFKKKLFVFYLVYTFVSYCVIGFMFGLIK